MYMCYHGTQTGGTKGDTGVKVREGGRGESDGLGHALCVERGGRGRCLQAPGPFSFVFT